MYAQMGKDIGGVIKEYGLNKEKQKKQKANIKSTVNFLETLTQNDPAMEDQYASMKEQLLNEDISLTERDTLASQGLKQVSLSSQLETQRLNQGAQRLANEFAGETRNLRADLLQQRQEFGKITNEFKQLELNEFANLSPKDQKVKIAQWNSLLRRLPSQEEAAIAQAGGIVQEQSIRDAYVDDVRGGPMGVAAQQATVEDLGVEQLEANIDRTRGLIEGLDVQMGLMRRPVDTSIPGNVDIGKEISAVTKEIDAILKSSSLERDDEDEPLTIEDLIEDVSLSGKITFSADANKISEREKIRLEDLIQKKLALQGEAKTTWIDVNGNTQESTIAEYEQKLNAQRRRAEEAREKERQLKREKDAQFRMTQPIGYLRSPMDIAP